MFQQLQCHSQLLWWMTDFTFTLLLLFILKNLATFNFTFTFITLLSCQLQLSLSLSPQLMAFNFNFAFHFVVEIVKILFTFFPLKPQARMSMQRSSCHQPRPEGQIETTMEAGSDPPPSSFQSISITHCIAVIQY